MQLLILNQFFYPDHSATSQLMTDFAEGLQAYGVQVTVVCGRGRYNGGKLLPSSEQHRGAIIRRAWSTSFGKSSVFGRLVDYLSFYIGASVTLSSVPRPDVIMALTTPPLINLLAVIIGRMRKIKVVSLVQDLYPDVAIALGAMSPHHPLVKIADVLNRKSLGASHRVIVLGECMHQRVAAKLTDSGAPPIDVIHNWAHEDISVPALLPNVEQSEFRRQHHLENKFMVMFSGNFGRVNDFGTVLEAARLLRRQHEICFVFVGDGTERQNIEAFVAQHRLPNVRVLPYQPRTTLSDSLAAADAHLVTLAEGLAGLSVPSKTYGVLATGRPILFVGDERSTTAKIVRDYECGAVIPSGASEKLARIIQEWQTDTRTARRFGKNGRAAFEIHFQRDTAIRNYFRVLTACATNHTLHLAEASATFETLTTGDKEAAK